LVRLSFKSQRGQSESCNAFKGRKAALAANLNHRTPVNFLQLWLILSLPKDKLFILKNKIYFKKGFNLL
jgi:hypothetical protein